MAQELKWYNYFKKRQTPVIPVLGKADLYTQEQKEYLIQMIQKNTGETVCPVSSETGEGIRKLKELLAEKIPEGYGNRMITGNLVSKDDLVLLVMPQDIQSPREHAYFLFCTVCGIQGRSFLLHRGSKSN